MIPALYEEVEDFACKRQRLEGVYSNQSNEAEDMVQHPELLRLVETMKFLLIHLLGLVVQVRNVYCSHKLPQLRS